LGIWNNVNIALKKRFHQQIENRENSELTSKAEQTPS
jgi:hypothetical protein